MDRNKYISIFLFLISLFAFYVSWERASVFFLGMALAFLLTSTLLLTSKFRELLLLLITAIMTLTVLEGCLLISNKMKPRTYYDPNFVDRHDLRERVEGFGYRLVPGVHTLRLLHTNGDVVFDATYTVGSDGYRQNLSNGPFSVYLFGGSFAFGYGLNDDETLNAYMKNEHGIGTKNLGVPAYGLHQALYNIENGLSAYEGVNVILTSPFHALRSSCKPHFAIGTPRYRIQGNLAVLNGVCPPLSFLQKVLHHSQVYHLISRAFFNSINVLSDDDIELYLAIIRSIFRETHRNNSKLLIAYIDAKTKQLAYTSWTNQTLIAKLRENSDQVVDVTLADTREQLARQYYIHKADEHPSADANKARAELIANFFR